MEDFATTADLDRHILGDEAFQHRRSLATVQRPPEMLMAITPDLARAVAKAYAGATADMLMGRSALTPPELLALQILDADCKRALFVASREAA